MSSATVGVERLSELAVSSQAHPFAKSGLSVGLVRSTRRLVNHTGLLLKACQSADEVDKSRRALPGKLRTTTIVAHLASGSSSGTVTSSAVSLARSPRSATRRRSAASAMSSLGMLASPTMSLSCLVISLAGVIILCVLAWGYETKVEVLMGHADDPKDGHAVAIQLLGAAAIYGGFVFLCGSRLLFAARGRRGDIRL